MTYFLTEIGYIFFRLTIFLFVMLPPVLLAWRLRTIPAVFLGAFWIGGYHYALELYFCAYVPLVHCSYETYEFYTPLGWYILGLLVCSFIVIAVRLLQWTVRQVRR